MKWTSVTAALLLVALMVAVGFKGDSEVRADVGRGVISIAFDDGRQSQYDSAFPLLQQYGMHATFYIITSAISDFSGDGSYMSIAEIRNLQGNGSEIGSHSVTHPDFTSLTDQQIVSECVSSKQLLQSYGLVVNNFAYPYGATNAHADSVVSSYYRSARSAYTAPFIMPLPTSQFSLTAYPGETGDPSTVSQLDQLHSAESIVDQAVSSNSYAIIFFHNIIPGDTSDSYEISAKYFQDFLEYVADSGVKTLTVNQALDIAGPSLSVSISPSLVSMLRGGSQTFASNVSGGVSPYKYQWYLNGSQVSGATSSSWTFTPASNGTFSIYLRVADSYASQVQSNTAIAQVKPPLAASVSPTQVRLDLGQSQVFNSSVSGGFTPYSCQWFMNGTAVAGANNLTWPFTPLQTGHYNVSLSVNDSLGNHAQSNVVSDILVYSQPSVTISPSSVNMSLGALKQFNSTVTGGLTPYVFQWFYANGTAISGATSSGLTYKANSTGTYNIYLNVTDNLNFKAKSNNATLNIYSQPTTTINPASVNITVGNTQQFTSTTSGGLAPYTYQWYYANNTAIAGATNSSLTYKPNSIGTYNIYLNATDSLNSEAKSNTATINVYSQPTVTISPVSVNMTVGGTKQFNSTVAGGLTPYTYQWYYGNGTAITGAVSSTLTFKANLTGTYSIYLNATDNLNSKAQSNAATVNVYSQPTVTISPIWVNMTIGGLQQFTSGVLGGLAPYSYQWYYANNTAIAGATASSLSYRANSTGTYNIYVNVTDSLNSKAQSNTATLNVSSLPTTTISIMQISDTQFLSSTYPDLYNSLTTWIVNNAATYNLKMVVHTGDITDQYYDAAQWVNANNSMAILTNNGIPYTWDAGNHDQTGFSDPNSGWVGNQYTAFNAATFRNSSYWVSDCIQGKNTAVKFSSNGYNFLVINLECQANATVMAWATNLLNTYSSLNYNIIVATHAYLDSPAMVFDNGLSGSPIWEQNLQGLLNGYSHVIMTLNGHTGNDPAISVHNQVNGRTQIEFDRQDTENNQGADSVRIYQFDLIDNTVTVSTYVVWDSTWLTSANDSFSFSANLTSIPTVSVNSTLVRLDVGQSQAFSSSVSGGKFPYSYQWFLNDSAVSGATGQSWTFTPNAAGHYKVYVNVTDSFNVKVQSNNVTDIVVYPLLATSISPASANVTLGNTQQFSSAVSGGFLPYTYQWYYANGTAITGATNSTLAYKGNSTGVYGIYLNVTDSFNFKSQSNVAAINVYSQPTVTVSPVFVNMTTGVPQMFTSIVTGGLAPYTYQWYLNNSQVQNATANTWTFSATTDGTYNIYLALTDNLTATAQSNNATGQSSNATQTIETPMNITISPTQVNLYAGQQQTFTSTISGGTSPYAYQWYLNGTAVLGATNDSYTFVPGANGNYQVYLNVTDSLGSQAKSNVADGVNVYSVYLMLNIDPQATYSAGQQVTFDVIILNQQNPMLQTSLALTITGPGGYTYYDFQPVNVSANGDGDYTFTWVVPDVSGTFVVEANLVPGQLTAYDATLLQVGALSTGLAHSSGNGLVVSKSLMGGTFAFFVPFESQVLSGVCFLLLLRFQGKKYGHFRARVFNAESRQPCFFVHFSFGRNWFFAV